MENQYWIGLTDMFSSRDFYWEPGHIKLKYSNWFGNEPSHRDYEDFVVISDAAHLRRWRDGASTEIHPSLCQVDLKK